MDWIRVDDNGYLVCRANPAGGTILPTSHCSINSTKRPRPADLLLAGEIADDEAHEAITDLSDALAELERREYIEYAESLTAAVQVGSRHWT